ncbi:MAG: DUF373 family protein [Nitrososphaeria archaeon]
MPKTLVLVVDRDNDVGVKAGIITPVVGRDSVLKAANQVLLADPEEADGNAMMGAIKVYDQLKAEGEDVEIALVAGSEENGVKADTRIRNQVASLKEKLKFEEVILVSDGVEDEEVLPIIYGFSTVRSLVRVVVKHSKNIEESYIVLGKYLRMALYDSRYSKYFLGVPGILLLAYALLYLSPIRAYAGYLLSLILGLALIVRGFNLDNAVGQMRRSPNFLIKFLSAMSGLLIVIFGGIKVAQTVALLPQFQQLQKGFQLYDFGYVLGVSLIIMETYIWVALGLQLVVNFFLYFRRKKVLAIREIVLLIALILFYLPVYNIGLVLMNPQISGLPMIVIVLGVLAALIIIIYYILADYLKVL